MGRFVIISVLGVSREKILPADRPWSFSAVCRLHRRMLGAISDFFDPRMVDSTSWACEISLNIMVLISAAGEHRLDDGDFP